MKAISLVSGVEVDSDKSVLYPPWADLFYDYHTLPQSEIKKMGFSNGSHLYGHAYTTFILEPGNIFLENVIE